MAIEPAARQSGRVSVSGVLTELALELELELELERQDSAHPSS